jgi:hypothetical protein
MYIKDTDENLKMCPLYTGQNYMQLEKMRLPFIDSDL